MNDAFVFIGLLLALAFVVATLLTRKGAPSGSPPVGDRSEAQSRVGAKVGSVAGEPVSPGADLVPRSLLPSPQPKYADVWTVPSPDVGRPLSDLLPKQFCVLDFETTGLSAITSEIIEFGVVRYSLDEEFHPARHGLVRPLQRIPTKITEITGITQAMVDADGIPLSEALRLMLEFIGDLPIVTYNASFDMAFLYRAADRHGHEVKNKYTCALGRAKRAWPELDSHRLAHVCALFKHDFCSTHRALGDCERALVVFLGATRDLNTKVRWSSRPRVAGRLTSLNE